MKKSKNKPSRLTKQMILDAFESQQSNSIWNFYDERQFLEELLSSRFNYFLLVYSVIITAFFTAPETNDKLFILILGFCALFLFWLTVLRIYFKVDIILKFLHNLKIPGNVFEMINSQIQNRPFTCRLFSVNIFIGIYIPLLCLISLFLLFIIYIVFTPNNAPSI